MSAAAFTSSECDLLEQALDVAWDMVRRSGQLDAYNLDTAKSALTRAILEGYEGGEHNARRLAIAAVAQIDSYVARVPEQRPQSPAA